MDNDKMIFLRNEILENKEMSDYDIAAYVSLTKIYGNSRDVVLINIDTILYDLYGKHFLKLTRKVKDNFKEAVDHLSKLGVITIIENCGRGIYIIDTNRLFFTPNTDNPFTTIGKEEMRNVLALKTEEKVDSLKLLRYFIMLMKTVNNKEKAGFMSIDKLTKLANISRQTVITYNKVLEDNKVIYMFHHNMIYSTGNDVISSLPNHYGRYRDKSKIKSYAKGYEEKQKNEMSDIKRKKKKAKENQNKKQQEETRYGISICKKKENTKVETSNYDYEDDDDVEF